MKTKSILVIAFAIAVMKISLGESRIFLRPNFWMKNSLDDKDAVVDLKLSPYREVVMKRQPSQDAVGLNPNIWKMKNDKYLKDAVTKAIETGIILLIDQVASVTFVKYGKVANRSTPISFSGTPKDFQTAYL